MIIKYWQGTDVLRLKTYHPTSKPVRTYIRISLHRLFWKIFHNFFKHWAHSDRFIPTLKNYGIKVVHTQPMPFSNMAINRVPHKNFTILCYLPKSYDPVYQSWVYGSEFIELAQRALPDCHFIKIDGNQDMQEIFPQVDVYLKYNRWEGQWTNRLAMECEQNGIAVYRTNFQRSDIENLKDFCEWLSTRNTK